MYSMVLLAALATTTDAPSCWLRGGHGCCGCYGYSGCYSCCGCYGSYGCCGCYGGCWGGHYGCGGYYGCGGCYGWYGSCGCCGGYGYDSGSYQGSPYVAPLPGGDGSGTGGSGSKGSPEGSGGKIGGGSESSEIRTPKSARLILDVPEDARVYVDNRLMKSASTHRVYSSPALAQGQAYYYDVRIEVERDGKVVTAQKRVIVRGGEEYSETFVDLGKKSTAVADASER